MSETAPNDANEFESITKNLPDHLSEYVTDRIEVGLDLFAESESVALDSIPDDSIVTIKAGGGNYVFYKSIGENMDPAWLLITEDENGNTVRTPVVMMGASATPSGAFMESGEKNFRKGQFFTVGELHQFQDGTEPGVPELYSELPPTTDLDQFIIDQNLKIGIMVRKQDGSIAWNVVTESIIPPIEQVDSFSPGGVSSY